MILQITTQLDETSRRLGLLIDSVKP